MNRLESYKYQQRIILGVIGERLDGLTYSGLGLTIDRIDITIRYGNDGTGNGPNTVAENNNNNNNNHGRDPEFDDDQQTFSVERDDDGRWYARPTPADTARAGRLQAGRDAAVADARTGAVPLRLSDAPPLDGTSAAALLVVPQSTNQTDGTGGEPTPGCSDEGRGEQQGDAVGRKRRLLERRIAGEVEGDSSSDASTVDYVDVVANPPSPPVMLDAHQTLLFRQEQEREREKAAAGNKEWQTPIDVTVIDDDDDDDEGDATALRAAVEKWDNEEKELEFERFRARRAQRRWIASVAAMRKRQKAKGKKSGGK